jgi:hypothetical protein
VVTGLAACATFGLLAGMALGAVPSSDGSVATVSVGADAAVPTEVPAPEPPPRIIIIQRRIVPAAGSSGGGGGTGAVGNSAPPVVGSTPSAGPAPAPAPAAAPAPAPAPAPVTQSAPS